MKSQFVQFLLTFFFGPLGLFYSSIAAAIGFIIAAIVFGSISLGVGALVIWPITILVGFATVSKHNKRIAEEERRHQELVQASNSTS